MKELPKELPDKMTGDDLIAQENYEFGLEEKLYNKMDKVDRRDKRNQIKSFVTTRIFRKNYDKIDWNK